MILPLPCTIWYFHVLREGTVQTGSRLRSVKRSCQGWTVTTVNDAIYRRTDDGHAAQHLIECPALTVRWRESLNKRGDDENGRIRRYTAG